MFAQPIRKVKLNPAEMPAETNSRKIVFLTAGAAGMFCGSCMHDNALAKALIAQGHDCLLQPIYTPIRTDSESIASERVFFGGVYIYAMQKLPWLRRLPAPLRSLLDSPALLNWLTKKSSSTDAKLLGDLSVSMLRGTEGNQSAEVLRLTKWMAEEVKPDAIILSNLLIGGALPQLRESMPDAKIAVLLQGDDIFLDYLPEPQKSTAIGLCQGLVQHVDLFVSNSQFYSSKMGDLLQIDPFKRREIPLSIETGLFASVDREAKQHTDRFDLGYFARITPEKGLHHLIDAFIATSPDHDTHLHVGGWLGEDYRSYFDQQVAKIRDAGLMQRYTHHGSPSLDGKIAMLSGLDLLCVPAEYEDPKGLFVLEALAAGTPVLQPDHGAFGELIQSTGGGATFRPFDAGHLAESLSTMIADDDARNRFAAEGMRRVLQEHDIQVATQRLESLLFADESYGTSGK